MRPTSSSTRHLRGLDRDGAGSSPSCSTARARRMAVVAEHDGAVEAVAYMKGPRWSTSHRERIRRIEAGEQVVVGQNRFTESEVSPLTADAEGGILVVDPAIEAEQIDAVRAWRAGLRPGRGRLRARRARAGRGRREPEPDGRDDRRRARRRDDRRVGARRCATCSAATARRPASARPRLHRQMSTWPRAARGGRAPGGEARDAGRRSSSASPASTATQTAPSRSPCARATPGWTSSTREFRPDAGADRGVGAAGGRPRDRAVDPVRLATAS